MHKHVPNSACFYLVCTYDDTQNILWHSVGENCIVGMLIELNQVSIDCIQKMEEVQNNDDNNTSGKIF